jgi:hypothetical protein
MVLVPPHLVLQWADEIDHVTGIFNIYVYFGDSRDTKLQKNYNLINKLTRTHNIFTGPKPMTNIVISSYFTMAVRHGQKKQRVWQVKNNFGFWDANTPDPAWPGCMYGQFSCLVLDEAHQICNNDTRQWRTAYWMRAPMNLLLTATPSFNTVDDLRALMPFLLNPENEKFWNGIKVPEDYDPFVQNDPSHECYKLQFTLRGLDRWIWNNPKHQGAIVGFLLKAIWMKCVVRRQVTSRLPIHTGEQIGKNIPPALRFPRTVSFAPREKEDYDMYSAGHLYGLIIKTREGQIVMKLDKFRMLALLGTWLPCHFIEKDMTAGHGFELARKLNDKGQFRRE